jgi:Na+/melibiose symporter-like transporter
VLIGLLNTLGLLAATAAVFFAFYFVAYEPYRVMYPDLIDDDHAAGRAQSTQALARGLGTASALLGGGLLLAVGRPAPFALAGLMLVVSIGAFAWLIWRRRLVRPGRRDGENLPGVARRFANLLRDHPSLRAYFLANALWELALSALKSFVVLYLVVGLHYSLTTSSLIIGAVALVILVGAGASRKAGDRLGRLLIIKIALVAYGAGFLLPALTTSRPLIVASIPLIALGGGTVMTLAYAILMPLMPEDAHGAMTGFYSLSRGVGIVSGPVLAGALISVSGSLFRATDGFQAMWFVCSLAAFASVPLVVYMRRAGADRRALRRL